MPSRFKPSQLGPAQDPEPSEPPAGPLISRRAALGVGAAAAMVPSILTPILSAQAPPASKAPPAAVAANSDTPLIRVEANEVIVPVTVTDNQGRFVRDLTVSDFEIWDENYRQTIKYFNADRNQPVVVGFLVDLSNNMKSNWKRYQEMTVEMVLQLLPGDKKYSGYLVGYGTKAEVMVNTTSDSDPIVAKLNKLTPAGGAAFYDAIWEACTNRKLVPGEPLEPHRVIVVIGDGSDSASKHTLDEVLEIAQRNLVSIFAVSTEANGFTSDSSKVLRRLAAETGGRVEYPLLNPYSDTQGFLSRPANDGNREFAEGTGGYMNVILGSIFKSITAIAGEITTQYILRYVPQVPGDYKLRHNVRVELPTIPNVIVRAKTVYYAPEPVK
ncbi:MAG: VWA domain-containing protein [Acidobacteriota bacterium]